MFQTHESKRRPRPATRRLRTLVQGGLVAGCLVFGSASNAALTFAFDFTDNAGTSEFLGDANQYRRDALVLAGGLFSNYFGSLFANSGTITFGVQGTLEDCTNGCTLAFAGSSSVLNDPGFGNGEVVRNKIQTGIDLNGFANDGVVGVNWGASWQLNPNTPVTSTPASDMDFFAALFHEFTHALGFAGAQQPDGSDGTSSGNEIGGIDYAGYWNKFDQFTTNCAGISLINPTTGITDPAYAAASTSAMCFAGANAQAAYGGAVPLYAPLPYEPGSSGSHLLEQGLNTGAMMKYDRDFNVDEPRTYNAVEIGVLMDLGYTPVSAVPEPASIALLFVGLAGIGGLTLRRRMA